jgi:hypothetical protein
MFPSDISETPFARVQTSRLPTVVMIDRRTGEIYWKLGAPPLSGQHAPTILPNRLAPAALSKSRLSIQPPPCLGVAVC